ncbi:GMC oxidoreductase [Streptomyces sp. NPDC047085]|uniref:GMC oxidoreductase n=1 Tax=Streptomyces sp. NPDC047085 TaxID=3155140 RepID=UPI0033D8CDDC
MARTIRRHVLRTSAVTAVLALPAVPFQPTALPSTPSARRDDRRVHRTPRADRRLPVQQGLGRHRRKDGRRDLAQHGHAPVLRAAGALHLPATAQGAARPTAAGRVAPHPARRGGPVPQRRPARLRRLAAHRPRRSRTGRAGPPVAEGHPLRRAGHTPPLHGRRPPQCRTGTCPGGAARSSGSPGGPYPRAGRVRGTDRPRIVDASVFPRIPGFFVAAPIYMISEKASDVILADTARA